MENKISNAGSEIRNLKPMEDMLHDVKIPLTIMYNDLLQLENSFENSSNEDSDENNSAEKVSSIKKNWFRVMKLVNDMGDFNKIIENRLSVNLVNLDIVLIIRESTNSCESLAFEKNISFEFTSDVESKIIAIDKEIIERILLNLISNAIKYSERDTKIFVKFKDLGDEVSFLIENYNINKNVIDVNTLFERYRKSAISDKNFSSDGIGLDIVKGLVNILDGKIDFKHEDELVKVKVTLPIGVAHTDNEKLKIDDFYSYNIFDIEMSDDYS